MIYPQTPGEHIADWFERHYNDMEGHWLKESLIDMIDTEIAVTARNHAPKPYQYDRADHSYDNGMEECL